MGTKSVFTAQGGTNGSAVLAADTGSGNQWTAVTTTGGAITYDNTVPGACAPGDTLAYKYVGSSNADFQQQYTLPVTSKQITFQFWLYLDGNINNATRVFSLLSASSTNYLGVLVNAGATPTIALQNNAGTTLWTSSGTLSTGVLYRFEGTYDSTAGATAIAINLDVYQGNTMTLQPNCSAALTGQTSGANDVGKIAVGRSTGPGTVGTFHMTRIAIEEARTTYFGPLTVPATIVWAHNVRQG